MRLYDIAEAYRALSDQLEAAQTPEEMKQTLADTLESIEGDFEDKAENMAALIAEYTATIEGCKAEIARLTGKAARAENAIASIKNYLKAVMNMTGKKKLKAGTWTISIAKNGGKAPIIWKIIPEDIDLEAIPEKYVRRSAQLNTAAIRETLEDGGFLSFAELGERGDSLRIK